MLGQQGKPGPEHRGVHDEAREGGERRRHRPGLPIQRLRLDALQVRGRRDQTDKAQGRSHRRRRLREGDRRQDTGGMRQRDRVDKRRQVPHEGDKRDRPQPRRLRRQRRLPGGGSRRRRRALRGRRLLHLRQREVALLPSHDRRPLREEEPPRRVPAHVHELRQRGGGVQGRRPLGEAGSRQHRVLQRGAVPRRTEILQRLRQRGVHVGLPRMPQLLQRARDKEHPEEDRGAQSAPHRGTAGATREDQHAGGTRETRSVSDVQHRELREEPESLRGAA